MIHLQELIQIKSYLEDAVATLSAVMGSCGFPCCLVLTLFTVFVLEMFGFTWGHHPWLNYSWITKSSTLVRNDSKGAKCVEAYKVPKAPAIKWDPLYELEPDVRLVVPIENCEFVSAEGTV